MNLKVIILVIAVLVLALSYIAFILPLDDATPPIVNKPSAPLCSSDLECGVSGFTGFYVCKGDNIFGEYIAYMCVDIGNSESRCKQIISMEFIKNCPDNEECVPGLRECKQTPKKTTTTLANTYQNIVPTSPTTTTLSDINCVRDSNCGIDHYGKPYCTSSGHSVRDYIKYKCVNPGTYSSRCAREKTTYLVDYCGFDQACIRGECVEKRYLSWYCVREDCCATDFSLCGNYSIEFLPFPIPNLHNETYVLEHNQTVYL